MAAAYDLEPGETWYRIGTGDDMSYEGILSIGNGGEEIEEYVDEEGNTSERWIVWLWLTSAQHPAAQHRPVRVGDVIEFEGCRIRVLDTQDGRIDVAISELSEPRSMATPTLNRCRESCRRP
jgi:hypothetical protein